MNYNNPWNTVSFEQRVAAVDLNAVQMHNDKYSLSPEKQISEIGIGEPFIGDPNAKVYLLQGSPLISKENLKKGVRVINASYSSTPTRLEECQLNNLKHVIDQEYPMFYLKPEYRDTPSFAWYSKVLKGLVKQINKNTESTNDPYSIVSKNIFVCELYGYHSLVTHHSLIKGRKTKLPSVDYTAALIRSAIRDNKLILLARGINSWYTLVPELQEYDNCHLVAGNRGITISKTTISPNAWKQLMKIMQP